ncbi:MAG TPA: porin family protein [Bacteroidales bacterium]|nr:porin family protein [Bacteroidales bacterium]
MKKHFIVLILLFIITSTFAQEKDFEPVAQFGIRQGINYSSVLFSPGINQGIKLGYTGGFVFKYSNEKNLALQIELNFSQKGWLEDLDTLPNSYQRNLDYIELPFLSHIYFGKRNVKFYVNIGPSAGYLIRDEIKSEITNELYAREYYNLEIDNKFDFNVLAGLGLIIDTQIGSFQTGFRYSLTLTDIFKYTSDSIFENSQNQVISFSLAYYFSDNRYR